MKGGKHYGNKDKISKLKIEHEKGKADMKNEIEMKDVKDKCRFKDKARMSKCSRQPRMPDMRAGRRPHMGLSLPRLPYQNMHILPNT